MNRLPFSLAIAALIRFVADAPPLDGIVTMTPQSGFAVTTAFAGTTANWVDEALENNTYAFYIFPYEPTPASNAVVGWLFSTSL